MEWTDKGTIIGVKKHGEVNSIAEVMTELHGRHFGLIRGGRSRRFRPVLQPGNEVGIVWRARLDEHLGSYQVELIEARAGQFILDRFALSAFQTAAALLHLLPEREPNTQLYTALQVILEHTDNPALTAELVIRLELNILSALGFGLDLGQCAKTGQQTDLVYVSPRSGRAVSREAGRPWDNQLLHLPAFLQPDQATTANRSVAAIEDGFRLTSFFLNRHVYEPRQISPPQSREDFVTLFRGKMA